jgi:lipid A 4'-phosphatase
MKRSPDVKLPTASAILAALALAGALALIAGFPELDLVLARRFYVMEGESFGARSDAMLILLRDLGYYLPIAVLAMAVLGWIIGRRRPKPGMILTGRHVLFLALSFALGPGLVVNGVLKGVSHRPRPVQIVEFGGPSAFRPWYAFDGACKTNCSFASGEVAGASWLVAPASLVPAPWRGAAIGAATIFTIAVALLRMAFGGHFASDVLAAALVSLASILAVGWALRRSRQTKA